MIAESVKIITLYLPRKVLQRPTLRPSSVQGWDKTFLGSYIDSAGNRSGDQKQMNAEDKFIAIQPKKPPTELTLHVREWCVDAESAQPPFVLVHGLSSNAHTWDGVARRLAEAGHRVVAVDQRGHGLSDKPDGDYDFDTVTDDLALLIDALGLDQPIVVGQSWGGNVMLALGARYPKLARGLGFIDGGTIDLQARPDGEWEQIKERLRPPKLAGTAYDLHGVRSDAQTDPHVSSGVE